MTALPRTQHRPADDAVAVQVKDVAPGTPVVAVIPPEKGDDFAGHAFLWYAGTNETGTALFKESKRARNFKMVPDGSRILAPGSAEGSSVVIEEADCSAVEVGSTVRRGDLQAGTAKDRARAAEYVKDLLSSIEFATEYLTWSK